MSGVYISGMEMPTNCWNCPIRNSKPCPCKGYSTALEYVTERHVDCPLLPVPKHGRLIDADKALSDNEEYYSQLGRPDGVVRASYRSVLESINLAPTIIPADKEVDNG